MGNGSPSMRFTAISPAEARAHALRDLHNLVDDYRLAEMRADDNPDIAHHAFQRGVVGTFQTFAAVDRRAAVAHQIMMLAEAVAMLRAHDENNATPGKPRCNHVIGKIRQTGQPVTCARPLTDGHCPSHGLRPADSEGAPSVGE